MGWTYIIECENGSYYTGSTRDLDARLEQHGLGGSRHTSKYKAKELRWAMEFDSVADAYRVERQIHGWSRAKKEALMRGDFEAVKRLASRAKKSRDEGVGG